MCLGTCLTRPQRPKEGQGPFREGAARRNLICNSAGAALAANVRTPAFLLLFSREKRRTVPRQRCRREAMSSPACGTGKPVPYDVRHVHAFPKQGRHGWFPPSARSPNESFIRSALPQSPRGHPSPRFPQTRRPDTACGLFHFPARSSAIPGPTGRMETARYTPAPS